MLTAEQLKLRQTGITGTDIAALAGLSPYQKPIDVFLKKTQPLPAEEAAKNPHMMRGIIMEEPVLRWYSILTGRAVREVGTIVHPDIPLVIATPDGVSSQDGTDDMVVEVKCPSWRTAGDWGEDGTDDIPDYYVPQVMWEMAVCNLHQTHVVAYMGEEPHIYTVDFSPKLFTTLVEIAEDFWQNHVLPKVPPPVDASDAYSSYLAERYPENKTTTLVEANSQIEQWASVLHDVEMQMRQLEARADEAKNHLRQYIGEHDGVQTSFGKITWKANKAKTVTDWQALCKATNVPDDLIERYTRHSKPVRVLNKPWSRQHKAKKK